MQAGRGREGGDRAGDRDAGYSLGREGEICSTVPIRLALVGCGAHAYRNILPPLRYIRGAAVTSFCDINERKARMYARSDGVDAAYYSDVAAMLDAERLDAVVVVVGFDDVTGVPLYPQVVEPILRRGLPVWMEKPPAADAAGVAGLIDAAQQGDTFAQVGFKKVFSPAVMRLHQLTQLAEFGAVSQYRYSYEVDLPAEVGNLRSPSGRRFLDDFVHVASVIDVLFGVPAMVQVVRGPSGAGVVLNQHSDGTIGTVALSGAASGLAPVERLEVIGQGANAVLENGAFLRYYPPGSRGPYGTSTSYLPPVTNSAGADAGPRFWEPEFCLGNLHGGSHFVQGYYQQLEHFIGCVQNDSAPRRCGLDAALRVMTYLDALTGPFNEWHTLPGAPVVTYRHEADRPQAFACPATGRALVLKDGWNYVCRDCGQTQPGGLATGLRCGLA